MNFPRRCLALVLLLGLPAAAHARSVGLGLGLELPSVTLAEDVPGDEVDQQLVTFEVPVFAGAWRLAPALGYASGRTDEGWGSSGRRITSTSFGLGVGRAFEPAEALRGWAGLRVGLVHRDLGGPSGLGTNSEDLFAGAVAGGEYFLGSTVSIGADVRLTGTLVELARFEGSSTTTGLHPGSSLEPKSGWSLASDFVLALRVYPW